MRTVKAIITSERDNKGGYTEFPITRVEAYSVDSAMDTDTDSFNIEIGDTEGELMFLLRRDAEVRVSLFSTHGSDKFSPLIGGIADTVNFSSDGQIIAIQGRDLSSLATDTRAEPGQWRLVRPKQFISGRAQKLGFVKLRIADMKTIPKLYTDGSESEWEFWYRIARMSEMWLWLEPDGTLVIDRLHYTDSPKYFFGVPAAGAQNPTSWVSALRLTIAKNAQQRVGKVDVYWEDGEKGDMMPAIDKTISRWTKKPLKIITSATAKSQKDAQKEADDVIFDSRVGALEIVLTIVDPGFPIKQNNMAQINVPQIGFGGTYFVVGTRQIGGPDGYLQEIRLREKGFALPRSVPPPPPIRETVASEGNRTTDLASAIPNDKVGGYGREFVLAAQAFHGAWDFVLFLGVLMAIGHKESGGSFKNQREISPVNGTGGVEWYDPNVSSAITNDASDRSQVVVVTKEEWKRNFANSAGNSLNPFGREAGVGCMQLTSVGYKEYADKYAGKAGEYDGGRWVPAANIYTGGYVLASKLSGVDSSSDKNIWIGVKAYNGDGLKADAYRDAVFALWEDTYKGIAEAAVGAVETSAPGGIQLIANMPVAVKKAIDFAMNQLGKPYLWGATGPAAWDCSGLVYGAYKAAGISGWYRGTTYTYIADNNFEKVTKDNLLPGDMVFFFERGGGPGHMGMMVDMAGRVIEAPRAGEPVQINSINDNRLAGGYIAPARRVVPWRIPVDRPIG